MSGAVRDPRGNHAPMTSAPGPVGSATVRRPPLADLVSVVVPNFNHGRFLSEAIESALEQDYRAIEIIVVDDGSTDDSRAVVEKYGGKVRYLWQENRGLPAARNTGISAACGEYVAFLDADDSWLPQFVSSVMARWRDDPELGAVHTGFYSMDQDGRRLPQVNISTVADDCMRERLVDGEFFVPSSVVARRECFERVGLFDEGLRGSEDWDMWLRVAREYRFAGIARPLVNYRIHHSNMSGDPDYMLRYQLMVAAKHFGPLEGPRESWAPEKQRAYAAVYRYAAQGYYFRGDLVNSGLYLRLALEANPALCESLDLYYELGCADQPLGRRTAGAQINLEKNATFLLDSLDDVFSNPSASSRLRHRRKGAFGHAYLALGLLAYGAQRLDLVRDYVPRALLSGPPLCFRRDAWSTLGKALLGKHLLRAARKRFGHHDRIGSQA